MLEKIQPYIDENPLVPFLLRENLLPVVERINKYLPIAKIWEYYHSTTQETGGKITFPYARIDVLVIAARDWVELLDMKECKPEKKSWYYQEGSECAMQALFWVEVGFEGLKNLAVSDASKNWTSAVGHFVTPAERAKGIMTTGKEMYDECIHKFISYRQSHEIQKDCFTEYGLEWLLQK